MPSRELFNESVDLLDEHRHFWLRRPLAEPMHECLGGHYDWALGVIRSARAA